MQKLESRFSTHPDDSKKYDTQKLREKYLISNLFTKGSINLTYSHNDRIIVGGILPTDKELTLYGGPDFGTEVFMERRELGIVNIGGPGKIKVNDEVFDVNTIEGMYIGMGNKVVKFISDDKTNPAKFYINSAPAHKEYPTVHITKDKAGKVELGSNEQLNKRTIFQFVHPAVCESCQLVMGVTVLDDRNVWNTMPCHTHERRMEVYFYFNMEPETRVFHLMGEAKETRHIVVKNEQAVISPSWSLHSGVGTSKYTFIWGMCGENKTFTDMDHIKMEDLK